MKKHSSLRYPPILLYYIILYQSISYYIYPSNLIQSPFLSLIDSYGECRTAATVARRLCGLRAGVVDRQLRVKTILLGPAG